MSITELFARAIRTERERLQLSFRFVLGDVRNIEDVDRALDRLRKERRGLFWGLAIVFAAACFGIVLAVGAVLSLF